MARLSEDMNPRTCIVTREAKEADELIRFVAGPDGRIVPDLRHRLPGRGVWVTARRARVDEAVAKGLFARGLKQAVKADENLGGEVDALLAANALSALSMAKKAGLIRTGAVKVDQAVRSGEAVLILHASDGAQDGVRKLDGAVRARQAAGGAPVEVASPFTSAQMDLALGGHNVIHAAAIGRGATTSLIERIGRLQHYRE